MSFSFEGPGQEPFHLSNNDYGKILTYYNLDGKSASEVLSILKDKYLAGDLEHDVWTLRNY